MVEIPVWMNSRGLARAQGLIAEPVMSMRSSGMIRGPPSMGAPDPSKMRPRMSGETESLMVSPRKVTPEALSMPAVPSKTWTTTMSPLVSRTWPRRMLPSGSWMRTTSL